MIIKEKKDTRVLVVDDDEQMRELIVEFLTDEGYIVESAINGRVALDEHFVKKHIDLVVSDINMPVMKGFDLLREVKERFPQTKRVLITAYNVEDYLDLALKYDIGNIFVKSTPFHFKELSAILSNLLTGDIFGVAKYFDDNAFSRLFTITRGDNLDAYATDIIASLPAVDTIKKVELVLIELIANAVFYGMRNELADDKDKWNYDFELDKNEAIEVQVMKDNEKFGVSILDKGGRLKKTDVLYWLVRQTTRDDAGIPLGVYDTHGRGFFIAREYIDRLIINIDKNKKTEVVIINYINRTFRGYKPLYINEL